MADLVTTTFNYGIPPTDGTRAWQSTPYPEDTDLRGKNWTHQSHEVQVENIRGKEDTVSLDTAGFQYHVHPTKFEGEFTQANKEKIRKEYHPECEELIRELTGASKVVIFTYGTGRCRSRNLSVILY